jgi:hypothetical protein
MPQTATDLGGLSAFSPSDVWIGWAIETQGFAAHFDGHVWRTLSPPNDLITDTGNVVLDGEGGYWFGDQAILTGTTWTEPTIAVSGGFGHVVRIPGTESFLQPASVSTANSSIQEPTIYLFDL